MSTQRIAANGRRWPPMCEEIALVLIAVPNTVHVVTQLSDRSLSSHPNRWQSHTTAQPAPQVNDAAMGHVCVISKADLGALCGKEVAQQLRNSSAFMTKSF